MRGGDRGRDRTESPGFCMSDAEKVSLFFTDPKNFATPRTVQPKERKPPIELE